VVVLTSDPCFNIGSDIKAIAAQWLYALDLAGFSDYAGSISTVRSQSSLVK